MNSVKLIFSLKQKAIKFEIFESSHPKIERLNFNELMERLSLKEYPSDKVNYY